MKNILDKQPINQDMELKEAIASETVALLYRAIPGSASATIIISLFLTGVLWQFFDDILLVLWLVVVTGINIARFVYINII